jgi:DMSO reductase anchor subunit
VGFLAPAALLLLASQLPSGAGLFAVAIATLGVGLGVIVERWLFFAEAQHVVTLFYGAENA